MTRRATCLFFLIWLCLPAMPSPGAEPVVTSPRSRLNLNGAWQFRMDPRDEGVAQQWYAAGIDYPDEIQVPGNWQAQGFGPARAWLRHDYQGKAWYRRAVHVPADWAGRRVWVHLGGTTNTANIYVNGKPVGFVEGFITPYEFDATEAVRPGEENIIACCVDSTGPAPVGMFNFVGRWGGLYRGAYLEARSDPAIDDVFVIPDVKNKTARTQVVLRRVAAGAAWKGDLLIRIAPVSGGAAVQAEGAVAFAADRQESEPATVALALPDMRPWSPEDPFLYSVEVSLSAGGKVMDTVRDRFGMRQFEVGPGGVLLLNGRPYFVRGLGDDIFEVLTGTQYPDRQIYIDRMRLIKRYGFNGVRFLAHTPIKEYFEAADEVGVLLMCEGVVYHKPKEVIPLLKKQVARIAKAYRNHPSWYIWSAGNEFFECEGGAPDGDWMDYILYAHATFKKLDPTRFFVASDGADVFPTDIITQRAKFDAVAGSGPEHSFDGLIDEVAYFKRPLGDAEIAKAADRTGGAGYPQTVLAMKPSGYWRFGETALGKVMDFSGQGHHGVYDPTMKPADLNQMGALAPGEQGGAIRTSAEGKGVSLRDVAADTFARGNEPFSISLWVKPSRFRRDDWGNCFSYGAAENGCALLIAEDGEGGGGKIVLGRYWSNFLTSEGALTAGCWNHIGITYDGSLLKLFLDGKLDKSVKVRLGTVLADGRIGNVVSERPKDRRPYQELPHIWHEFPNTYVGPLPDLTVTDKFTGVYRDDDYLSYHRMQIGGLGLTDKYPAVYQRSVDLYYLYLKHVFESARRSPTMDGYGLWLMTDTPAGPEGDANFLGIFNLLYEPAKFPHPAPILRFNRETVLLIDAGIEQRVLAAGETRRIPLCISHYGEKPIDKGLLSWEVTSQEQTLQQGVVESIHADPGEVKSIATLAMGPYEAPSGRRLQLHVRLDSSACRQENQWDLWVFPLVRPSLRSRHILNLTGVRQLDERYGLDHTAKTEQTSTVASTGPSPAAGSAQLILANRWTADVVRHLADGGTVLLLAEQGALTRPRGLTFWAQWIRSTGTFIENHPALDGFPHDGFCASQFYRLFGDAVEALQITEKGSIERDRLSPIVWGLCGDYDPATKAQWHEPRNRWKLYRSGLICEGQVASGRLVVCCLRVLSGIQKGYPEAGGLLDSLVDYALSARKVAACPVMSVQEASQLFQPATPSSRQ